MNRIFFCFLTGLCLLLLALACRHTPDVVVPVVTPPVSTTVTPPVTATLTSTTYTVPTDLATAYADVPQPPIDCRIVKITYKTVVGDRPILNPEYVTIGNTEFQISINYTTTYMYDNQRRLVWEHRHRSTGQPDSTQYVYGSGQVLKYKCEYNHLSKRYYNDTTTYPVDTRSYPISIANRQQVDPNGFLIRAGEDDANASQWITYTIKDMNVTSIVSYNGGGFGMLTISINRYNNRPELPVLTPFVSRPSRNLIASLVYISSGSTFWKDGQKFQENHAYTFDLLGRVKREVVHSFSLASDWPYQSDPAGIGVTDYEYSCP